MAKKDRKTSAKGAASKSKDAKTKAKKDGPTPAKDKKRGATGQTWGLNVGQTWLRLLEQNRKKRLTDVEMRDFMRTEFPNNKEYSLADIKLHRNLFNRGRIRDQEPFGEELPDDEKLHEYKVKDGKKVKLPLKAKAAPGKGKKKKTKTEDVADEADLDDDESEDEESEDDDEDADETEEEDEDDEEDEDEEEEEEEEPAPKKRSRKGKGREK